MDFTRYGSDTVQKQRTLVSTSASRVAPENRTSAPADADVLLSRSCCGGSAMPTRDRVARERRRATSPPDFVTQFLLDTSSGECLSLEIPTAWGPIVHTSPEPYKKWLAWTAATNWDRRGDDTDISPALRNAVAALNELWGGVPRGKEPSLPLRHPAVDWIRDQRLVDVRQCPTCGDFFLAKKNDKFLCGLGACKMRRFRDAHPEHKLRVPEHRVRVKPKMPRRQK